MGRVDSEKIYQPTPLGQNIIKRRRRRTLKLLYRGIKGEKKNCFRKEQSSKSILESEESITKKTMIGKGERFRLNLNEQ